MSKMTQIQLKLMGGYLLILFLIILSTGNLCSQTLTLKDQQTLEPIPFANIVSKQLITTLSLITMQIPMCLVT